jgi:hypothetical protein
VVHTPRHSEGRFPRSLNARKFMSKLRVKFNLCAVLVVAIVLFVGAFLTAPSRVAAQGTTATILGTVTDPSGGTVPEAEVQVKNTGTGITQSVTSDTQGGTQFPILRSAITKCKSRSQVLLLWSARESR